MALENFQHARGTLSRPPTPDSHSPLALDKYGACVIQVCMHVGHRQRPTDSARLSLSLDSGPAGTILDVFDVSSESGGGWVSTSFLRNVTSSRRPLAPGNNTASTAKVCRVCSNSRLMRCEESGRPRTNRRRCDVLVWKTRVLGRHFRVKQRRTGNFPQAARRAKTERQALSLLL